MDFINSYSLAVDDEDFTDLPEDDPYGDWEEEDEELFDPWEEERD